MIKLLIPLLLIFVAGGYLFYTNAADFSKTEVVVPTVKEVAQKVIPSISPKLTLQTPPQQKVLPGGTHVFQSFNNCGPAALSMALSFYGIYETQAKLGQELRPYQIPGGDNDDKSVTLEELAEKSKDYELIPYHLPNGNLEQIKLFITYDMPVITRTWTKVNEDIGHYRVVKGYDETAGTIIQDDSLQGRNLQYSYGDFNTLWEKFNFEYLVLVPKEKQEIVDAILGDDANPKAAWAKAVSSAQKELTINPDNVYARFNLSVAYYNTGNYQKSAEEFEKVENRLPFRTLWYQIEPIQAYYELGNYDRVFEITNRVLNNHNRAFSELYLLRGRVFLQQGNPAAAKAEFEKAMLYNKNLKSAQEAVVSI